MLSKLISFALWCLGVNSSMLEDLDLALNYDLSDSLAEEASASLLSSNLLVLGEFPFDVMTSLSALSN